MFIPYNLYNFEAPFKQYLVAGNVKPISIKNYLSDFRHFTGWMTTHKKAEISSIEIEEYKDYLVKSNVPIKTINRRLSTLRKFCSFCISQGYLKENPARQVANVGIANLLHQFQNDTNNQNVDLDDINEFFTIINS